MRAESRSAFFPWARSSVSGPIGLSHTSPGDAGSSQTFTYTPGGQLAGQTQTADAQVWSGQPVTTVNFTHDQLNRDAAIATASGYDAKGNLISDGTRTFTYDAENRLRTVTGGPASTTLTYDAWGRLDTVTANGATTAFRYAGASLAAEYALVGSTPPTLLRSYVYGLGDHPLMQVGGDVTHPRTWFHQDRLGSVIATSNAGGAITPYTYGPYGEPQSWAGSRFRYTGQIAIPEAQLYHYRARVYDPMMGRFLQADPIGTAGGMNLYAYVGGDPINATDPSGLWSCRWVAALDYCERTDPIDPEKSASAPERLPTSVADFNSDPVVVTGRYVFPPLRAIHSDWGNGFHTNEDSGVIFQDPETLAAVAACHKIAGPVWLTRDECQAVIEVAQAQVLVCAIPAVTPACAATVSAVLTVVTGVGAEVLIHSQNAKPPPGSRPIDQTPWSGDHQGIKAGIGAGPKDNVKIDPDGNVWGENPNGTWTDHGPAGDYTGSGNPSGQRGKDRGR